MISRGAGDALALGRAQAWLTHWLSGAHRFLETLRDVAELGEGEEDDEGVVKGAVVPCKS